MKAFTKYWSLLQYIVNAAVFLKTPVVIPKDLAYVSMPYDWWVEKIRWVVAKHPHKWTEDVYDCDKFSFRMVAKIAEFKVNGIGILIGRGLGTAHVWNIVSTSDKGLFQLEPQTGEMFKHKKGYRPFVAIL